MNDAHRAGHISDAVERIKERLGRGPSPSDYVSLEELQDQLRFHLHGSNRSDLIGLATAAVVFVPMQVAWSSMPNWNGGIFYVIFLMASLLFSAYLGDLVIKHRREIRISTYSTWLNANYDPKYFR